MNTILLSLLLLTTGLKPSYTKEEIRAEYDNAIKQTSWMYDNRWRQISFVVDTAKESWLIQFFRENEQIISYLTTNYWQVAYEYHKRMKPDGTVQEIVDDSAKLNTVMFERMLPLISNHLTEKGSKIEGYEPWKKPQITLNRLAGNAVKFFFPDSVNPDGRMVSHICVGVNGFKDIRDLRSVMIEAFCWSVVNPIIFEENSPLMEEFNKAMSLANDLQLSSDEQTKLKRYQGVVWAYMSQSKVLRDLLLAEYEKKKHLLTFTLKQ